jgi:tetratricopeptide (TPR) repeat protein
MRYCPRLKKTIWTLCGFSGQRQIPFSGRINIQTHLGETMQTAARTCLFIATGLLSVQALAKSASEVFEQVSPSVVVVYGSDAKGKKQSQGSGVVLPGGEVATNCHVLKSTPVYSVNYRDKTYPATISYSDWDRDVCSLTVPGLSAIPALLGSTRNLKVGQRVYVIGAPRGLELTLSEGIVSSLREIDSGRYIQTTAPISPGSSGGGMFDDEGRLIGLPTFYLDKGQQLNFAVPVEWVKALPGRHATQAQTGQGENNWLNQAISLEQKQDWLAMLRHSQRWTQAQPRSRSAWTNLGIAYRKTGQTAKAIEPFHQALLIDLENANAWNNLGVSFGETGQSAKAIECYQQALHIEPEHAGAWYNLGNAYRETGQSAKAIETYQQALLIDPEYTGAWFNLGNAYRETGQSAKAIETYQQTLLIDPKYSDVWVNLGGTYWKAGQSAKAIEAYQQALRINPEETTAWKNLGVAYKSNGQMGKVMEIYRQLKTLDPNIADEFFSKVVLP